MTSRTHAFSTSLSGAGSVAPSRPSIVGRVGRLLWGVLEQAGARRTRTELLRLANEHEATRPEFAVQLRAAARRGWL